MQCPLVVPLLKLRAVHAELDGRDVRQCAVGALKDEVVVGVGGVGAGGAPKGVGVWVEGLPEVLCGVVGGGGRHGGEGQGKGKGGWVGMFQGAKSGIFACGVQLALLSDHVVVSIAVAEAMAMEQVAYVLHWGCKLVGHDGMWDG